MKISIILSAILVGMIIISCNTNDTTTTVNSANSKTNTTGSKEKTETNVQPASSKKKIYLTFDDGPNKGTRNVLTIVNDEKVAANFFLIGQHTNASTEQKNVFQLLKNDSLIELYNHSFSHAWRNKFDNFYAHPDSVINDFKKGKELIGISNNVVRTPGRNAWRLDSIRFVDNKKSTTALDALYGAGFAAIGWDLEWHYNSKTLALQKTANMLMSDVDSFFKHNKTRTPNQLVLLAHDQVYKKTADSLELRHFIQLVKAHPDYELEYMSKYPGVSSYIQKSATLN